MKNTEEKFQQKYTDLRLRLFSSYAYYAVLSCGQPIGKEIFSPKGWMNCDPAKRYLYIEDF